jgi:hypothetical protein
VDLALPLVEEKDTLTGPGRRRYRGQPQNRRPLLPRLLYRAVRHDARAGVAQLQ